MAEVANSDLGKLWEALKTDFKPPSLRDIWDDINLFFEPLFLSWKGLKSLTGNKSSVSSPTAARDALAQELERLLRSMTSGAYADATAAFVVSKQSTGKSNRPLGESRENSGKLPPHALRILSHINNLRFRLQQAEMSASSLQLMFMIAELYESMGRFELAHAILNQARDSADAKNLMVLHAKALIRIGLLETLDNNPREGMSRILEGIAAFEGLDKDDQAAVEMLQELSHAAWMLGPLRAPKGR